MINSKILELLEKNGCQINYARNWTKEASENTKEVIESIEVNLTPEEWYSLCTRDGDNYIGGCCGQTGYTQDFLNTLFRDSGTIDNRLAFNLWEIAHSHDGFEILLMENEEELIAEAENWDSLYPLDKIWLCVAAAKPRMKPPTEWKHYKSNDEPEDAISALYDAIQFLTIKDFFNNEPGTQHKCNVAMDIIKAIPAAKEFLKTIGQLLPEPIEGFAIVDQNNKIQRNGRGYTVYVEQQEAQKILDMWKKMDANEEQEDQKNPDIEQLTIKPVRVSVDNGLEIF